MREALIHENGEVAIERATARDGAEIAALYLASRAHALPYLRRVHSDADVRNWIEAVMLANGETWIARSGGTHPRLHDAEWRGARPALPAARTGAPRHRLAAARHAKTRSPGHLRLFTFQRNQPARVFYEAHGFSAVEMNDGSRNEEREPDILYAWREKAG